MAEPALIAVDWGTSNFRGFLLDGGGQVREVSHAELGILQVEGGDFAGAFRQLVGRWTTAYPETPVLLSGMIGSRQGWTEAPYVECPAAFSALAAALHPVPGTPYLIVPGLSARGPSGVHDVIRGEETQVVGAGGVARRWLCLPGTHAKWVQLDGDRIEGFHTAMTGEIYAALCDHTILGRLMEGAADDAVAFDRGLARAGDGGGLLNHLFGVRAEGLFGVLAPGSLRSYLSGILIGHEIAGILAMAPGLREISVVGAADLTARYRHGLRRHGIAVEVIDGEAAAARGLWWLAAKAGLLGREPQDRRGERN
ncbi:MAG: 2-dehydro-3-deoxygalactonokinase [Alphaproteobacteria bacterium]